MHTAIYFAAFGILTIVHALRVIRLRRVHRVPLGDGGNADLERMMRVFGNHTEYVPIGLVLLIALEFEQAPVWYMHACGLCLLCGRLLHAYGLGNSQLTYRVRGMQLTFASLALSSFGVLLWSVI